MKKVIALLLFTALVFTVGACSNTASAIMESTRVSGAETVTELGQSATTDSNQEQSVETASVPTAAEYNVEYDQDDLEVSTDASNLSYVRLDGDSVTFEGSGATVNGSVVTITAAGKYNISGTLDDGQIIVDTQDEETVFLVLDGANITCLTSAPIYVSNADKVVITLADGTENYMTDGDSYTFADAESDEPNAAVFSKDDLTINGSGSLTVNANYNNGIASKDDLKITGGSITVNAVNDGIKGRDSVAMLEGEITINAGADGIQANNDEDAEKGYISIEGGTLDITADLDGVQAETNLGVSGGDITIVTGGGSVASSGGGAWGGRGMEGNPNQTTDSAKGLKAGVNVTITGGAIQISSLDDAIHSNDSIAINGGDLTLASGDDGIHADATLTINGSNLEITECYEGLESEVITINNGTIHLISGDDGINASSGSGSGAAGGMQMAPRGLGGFESGDNSLYINGGYIVVDAGGDGIDANGPIEMTEGTVIVNGPTNNGNGALDYMGSFNISGGYLVAVGSSGMAEAPSTSSTQYSAMVNLTSSLTGGTLIHIESESGDEVLSFEPTKAYQSVVLSSPELENGETYVVYAGGNSTGTGTDGLYSGGTYSGGTQVTRFTISGMVTGAGSQMGGFRGGRPPRP
jgi:hypothetical protein